MIFNRSARVTSRLAAACAMALAATVMVGPAQASLASPVTVSLIAPGGIAGIPGSINVKDVVSTATGIVAGDGSQIGSTYMLSGESILFSGDSILLHVAVGFQDPNNGHLLTGYLGSGGRHARYEFDNLGIQNATIAGASIATLSGASGAAGQFVAPGRFEFYLDDLLFTPIPGVGTGDLFGEFRIDLLPATVTVPLPASGPLVLMVLLALAALRLVPHGRRV